MLVSYKLVVLYCKFQVLKNLYLSQWVSGSLCHHDCDPVSTLVRMYVYTVCRYWAARNKP